MLDPDQLADLKNTPALSFDALMGGGVALRPTSTSKLLRSNPRGKARTSPKNFEEVLWGKTSWLTDNTSPPSSPASSKYSKEDNQVYRTGLEVSKYAFYEQLLHYMERVPVRKDNSGTVGLAIMVEAGSVVRKMGTMTKVRREAAFYEEYMNLLSEILDEMIRDEMLRTQMMRRFKGMRKGKYETEMTALKKISYKFPLVA
jgi:hypothetical protein